MSTISQMRRSYEADDRVFQRLRAEGKSSWDEQGDAEASFERFLMRPFLEEMLEGMVVEGRCALEVGCGSGPISCYLAGRGMIVRGIDVSPTALEMARENATARGLNVRFDLADICRLSEAGERYDVVVDGHCLHCIVEDEDRRRALGAVRRLLGPGGVFLLETMIVHGGLVIGEKYRLDGRGVLSIRVDEGAGVEGALEADGRGFAPYRRLLRAEEVARELGEAGFGIEVQRAVGQKDARKPMLLQVRAGVA